ncbi:MAG: hypothetical protein KF841_00300 [Phycisphaerae bacterium]|nr:hypothetical protein [Phycisphaerae bacterium]
MKRDASKPLNPTDPTTLSPITLTTCSTLRTDFRATDGGKTAGKSPSTC